jgi:pimeloyl-ACP methyl ester carboxylesterase
MGSLIALELSHIAPQQVQSLALLGTAVPMPVGQALQDATASAPMQAMHQINAWSHRPSVSAYRSANPGFNPIASGAALMARMAQRHGNDVLISDFAACNAYDAGLERAKNLAVPTLIMNGVNDTMTPPKAARGLASVIVNARLVLLSDCGHALMGEQPDAVLMEIRQHLAL